MPYQLRYLDPSANALTHPYIVSVAEQVQSCKTSLGSFIELPFKVYSLRGVQSGMRLFAQPPEQCA